MDQPEKKLRGWALMKARDPDRQREVAASGGRAMPNEARSFTKSPTFASECGRKGGAVRKNKDQAE